MTTEPLEADPGTVYTDTHAMLHYLAVEARSTVEYMLIGGDPAQPAVCAYCRSPKAAGTDTCKHCGATENEEIS